MTIEECQKKLEALAEAYDFKCRELVAALDANQCREEEADDASFLRSMGIAEDFNGQI